ncbi:hypothetical protein [Weissella viridescens]|uniref:hypothetical protein n=1 Tax=Weissella viridescens TaxID=1629 RepID=UPI003AF27727
MVERKHLIEFALVTPHGLETDENGVIVHHIGRLPQTFHKDMLKVNDLLAVSTQNAPFRLGVVTKLDAFEEQADESGSLPELVFTKPNQEDALIGFVKRLALQTGRTKVMHK